MIKIHEFGVWSTFSFIYTNVITIVRNILVGYHYMLSSLSLLYFIK